MSPTLGARFETAVIWLALGVAVAAPIIAAAQSPLLAWREPVYIVAGFAGIIAMTLLLMQPLLATGKLPGVSFWQGRHVHRWVGAGLIVTVVVHVIGLWVTSPPDVVDALLFVSPTPFSAWGVIAMWAVFGSGCLALLRRRLRLRVWRVTHKVLATLIVAGTIIHAIQIEGTMEDVTKVALSALLVGATLWVWIDKGRATK